MISSPSFRRLPLSSSAERLSKGRLRYKLLALWLGSILATLLLVGLVTTSFLDDFRQREAQRDIGLAMKQFRHEQEAVSANLGRQALLLAGHQPVIAALNMVGRYQDVTDYKPLVFDGEKRSQAILLAERSRSANLDFVAIYDVNGTVAAYAAPDGAGHHSVVDGQEILLRQDGQDWVTAPKPLFLLSDSRVRMLSGAGPLTGMRDGRVTIESVVPVTRAASAVVVGYVHTARIIGDDVLTRLSHRTGIDFAVLVDGARDSASLHAGPLPPIDPARFTAIPEITAPGDCPCAWLDHEAMTIGATRMVLDDGASAIVMAGASTGAVSAVARYYEKASLLVLLAVAALVAPAGLLLLNNMILLPLSRLMDGVEALRQGRRIQLGQHFKDDEFGALAANFDAMADDIADREDELRRTIDQLSRSRAELERLTAIAAHDLQEPLRLVASYTQLLKRRYGNRLDADADEFIGYAVEGAERMKVLIQNVLDYHNVEHETPFTPVDMNAVLQSVIESMEPSIAESGAEIAITPLPVLHGDRAQLVLAFEQLLSNAVKFRRGPPKIQIGARQLGLEWVIDIADNGIGIEPQYLPQLFTLFRRLHTSREYPGCGFGLAIARRIIEHHSGRIWAESQPGQGTTIHVGLPAG